MRKTFNQTKIKLFIFGSTPRYFNFYNFWQIYTNQNAFFTKFIILKQNNGYTYHILSVYQGLCHEPFVIKINENNGK